MAGRILRCIPPLSLSLPAITFYISLANDFQELTEGNDFGLQQESPILEFFYFHRIIVYYSTFDANPGKFR